MGDLIQTIKITLPIVAIAMFQILSSDSHAQKTPFPSGSGVIEGDAATVGAIIMGGYFQSASRPGTVSSASKNSSNATWTSPSLVNVPTGTQCGSATQGSRIRDPYWTACQGYNPRNSCPVSFYQAITGEANGVYFYTCIKS